MDDSKLLSLIWYFIFVFIGCFFGILIIAALLGTNISYFELLSFIFATIAILFASAITVSDNESNKEIIRRFDEICKDIQDSKEELKNIHSAIENLSNK